MNRPRYERCSMKRYYYVRCTMNRRKFLQQLYIILLIIFFFKYQTEQEKAQLSCFYYTNSEPLLYISPVKTEILSLSPYVVQTYDVLTESTIKELIQLSHSSLTRSQIVYGEPRYDSSLRTSVEAHIFNPFPRLTSRIEAITGLSVELPSSSDSYLVASYTSGGYVVCHLDAGDITVK